LRRQQPSYSEGNTSPYKESKPVPQNNDKDLETEVLKMRLAMNEGPEEYEEEEELGIHNTRIQR
jgi:hypothetical protein